MRSKAKTTVAKKADAKGRITLPPGSANQHFLITQVSENELRVMRAEVVPAPTAWFWKNEKAQALAAKGLEELAAGDVEEFDLDSEEKDQPWLHPDASK